MLEILDANTLETFSNFFTAFLKPVTFKILEYLERDRDADDEMRISHPIIMQHL